jgi:hypothetical protein
MKPRSLLYAEQRLRVALDAGDVTTIDVFSDLVDMLDELQRAPTPALGDAAMWYAQHGLHVFPLLPRSKRPFEGSHGLHDATCASSQVAQWWGERPDANIGLATGIVVDVIDIDGEQGERAMLDVLAMHPTWLSDALGIVSTPRPGGRHFYVPVSGHGNSASDELDHIDYRGRGGYVVAPPSAVDEPTYSGTYVWHRLLDVSALARVTSAT